MGAVTADKVIVELEARLGAYMAEVRRGQAVWEQSMARTQGSMIATERQIKASTDSIRTSLKATASTIAASFSVTAVKNYADAYTRYTNQLKVAGLEGQGLATTQDRLFEIAQRYGVELESLGTLYARSSSAAKDLGASQEQLFQFTEGVSAALKVQGGDASQAAGALLQLSQALGGGIVRAEEFNSIMEGARPIAQAAANGIERFGGSVSKLRTAVADGKVTSQEFFQGFLKGSKDLQAQAEKANLTIAASFQVLNNAIGKYIGEADQSLSGTQKLSQAIQALADNLDSIVPALTAIAVLIGLRYVGAVTASTVATLANASAHAFNTRAIAIEAAATAQMLPVTTAATAASIRQTAAITAQAGVMTGAAGVARGLGGALLGAFGGPIGLAITAVGAALIYAATQGNSAAIAARELKRAQDALKPTLEAVEENLRKAAGASDEVKNAHLRAANAALAQGRAEIAGARMAVQAAKAKVAALEEERIARVNSGGYLSAKVGNPGDYTASSGRLEAAEARLRGLEDAQINAGLAERRGSRGRGTYLHYKTAEDLFIERQEAAGGGAVAPAGKPKKDRKGSGPTPEELAAKREDLRLEQELAVAQAAGDKARIEALERQAFLRERTKAYTDAGMKAEDALTKAKQDQLDLDEAAWELALKRRSVEAVEVGSSPDLSPGLQEAGSDLADQQAALTDMYANAFEGGLWAAIRGGGEDVAEYFANQLTNSLVRDLSQQLGRLLVQFQAQMATQDGGGGFWSQAIGIVAGAFTGGGGGSTYAGGYAKGGEFGAGRWATVGEQGAEAIYAKPGGGVKVLSNAQLKAAPQAQPPARAAGGVTVVQPVHFDLRGAVMTEDLMAQVNAKAGAAAQIGMYGGAARGAAEAASASSRRQMMRIPR